MKRIGFLFRSSPIMYHAFKLRSSSDAKYNTMKLFNVVLTGAHCTIEDPYRKQKRGMTYIRQLFIFGRFFWIILNLIKIKFISKNKISSVSVRLVSSRLGINVGWLFCVALPICVFTQGRCLDSKTMSVISFSFSFVLVQLGKPSVCY